LVVTGLVDERPQLVDLGDLDDFDEGGRPSTVTAAGRELVVVRWAGDVYVFSAICPHQLAPMGEGVVKVALKCSGKAGAVEADLESPVLACPWHGWEFRLSDGRPTWNLQGPRLKTFRAAVEGERLLVDMGSRQ
jgi:nitrite reductase (NADH) small subunit